MNEEPIFSDRFIPMLALPGVLLSGAVGVLDMLDGKSAPSIWLWLFMTASLGLASVIVLTIPLYVFAKFKILRDRKSTRLNSSHQIISYAVFCLKKKNVARDVYTEYSLLQPLPAIFV